MKRLFIISIICILSLLFGCKKFNEIEAPINSLNAENVFKSDATAIAAMTGIYTKMSNSSFNLKSSSITSTSLFAGESADEITLFNLNDATARYYKNDLLNGTSYLWNAAYDIIFTANTIIEGLENATELTPVIKVRLEGEAKFIRAFTFFYLVNLYGDVPLPLTSNYRINASLLRTPKNDVYLKIIEDLKDAINDLPAAYMSSDLISSTSDRIRPNKWTATALLARVYLYNQNWADAEIQATAVINASSLYSLSPLADVFKKNSNETIWALQPVLTGTSSNTGDGSIFILPAAGPNTGSNPVYLSASVVNSFENGDNRKSMWTNSVFTSNNIRYYFPYKYKIGKVNTAVQEYPVIFRLAEQYLIRGEARAQLNNITGAQNDINSIRSRAGLGQTSGNVNKLSLLNAIVQERRVELFTEWGHRWLDLKRTNTVDQIMTVATPLKGGTWSSYKALFPIPNGEIVLNSNLLQNPGY